MKKTDRLIRLLKRKISLDFKNKNGFELNDDFFELKSRKSMEQATEIITIIAKNAKKMGYDSNESLAKEIAKSLDHKSDMKCKNKIKVMDSVISLLAEEASSYLSKESYDNKTNNQTLKHHRSKLIKKDIKTSFTSEKKPFDPTFVEPSNLDEILLEDNSFINSMQNDGKLMFRQAYMYAYMAYVSDTAKNIIGSDFLEKNLKRCAILIKHGANPFIKDGRGFNAFDGTEQKFQEIFIKYILEKENIKEYSPYALNFMNNFLRS